MSVCDEGWRVFQRCPVYRRAFQPMSGEYIIACGLECFDLGIESDHKLDTCPDADAFKAKLANPAAGRLIFIPYGCGSKCVPGFQNKEGDNEKA